MSLHSSNVGAINVFTKEVEHETEVIVPLEHADAKFVICRAWRSQFSSDGVKRYVNGDDSKHSILPCTGVVVGVVVDDVVADVVGEVVPDVVDEEVAVVVGVLVTVVTSQFTKEPACRSTNILWRVCTLLLHPEGVTKKPSGSQVKLAASRCIVNSEIASFRARATKEHCAGSETCMIFAAAT